MNDSQRPTAPSRRAPPDRRRPGGRPDRQVVPRPTGGQGRQPAPGPRRGRRPAGPNGAGKTTCFYMITGLIAADYGAIYLDGEDITAQPMYQRARMGLGYLPQETSIFRGMTVEQNVMAVVELREPTRAKVRAITTELLEELHIAHLRTSPAVALVGRRAAAGGDRPGPGQRAGLHAAGRALRRHRPPGHRRHPRGDRLSARRAASAS